MKIVCEPNPGREKGEINTHNQNYTLLAVAISPRRGELRK
jgi:hypothetical protein